MNHLTETTSYIKYLAVTFFEHFPFKFIGSFFVGSFGFLFGADMNSVLGALITLVTLDFITGLVCAYKQGEQIKSRVALRSAVKLGVYGILVSSAHLTEQAVPGTTFMGQGMIAFLAVTEMISIVENAGKMGFAIPKKLLNQLIELRGDGTK